MNESPFAKVQCASSMHFMLDRDRAEETGGQELIVFHVSSRLTQVADSACMPHVERIVCVVCMTTKMMMNLLMCFNFNSLR